MYVCYLHKQSYTEFTNDTVLKQFLAVIVIRILKYITNHIFAITNMYIKLTQNNSSFLPFLKQCAIKDIFVVFFLNIFFYLHQIR